jgi:hypothetical protein
MAQSAHHVLFNKLNAQYTSAVNNGKVVNVSQYDSTKGTGARATKRAVNPTTTFSVPSAPHIFSNNYATFAAYVDVLFPADAARLKQEWAQYHGTGTIVRQARAARPRTARSPRRNAGKGPPVTAELAALATPRARSPQQVSPQVTSRRTSPRRGKAQMPLPAPVFASPPRAASPRAASPRPASPRSASPRAVALPAGGSSSRSSVGSAPRSPPRLQPMTRPSMPYVPLTAPQVSSL